MNHTDTKGTSHERGQKHDPPILMFWNIISNVLCRGRSRGRVQGECTSPPPLRWPAVFWCYWYSEKKKCTMWFIGVEVEQETRAPPPKCSVFVPIFVFVTLRTITPISGVHYGTQNYRRLMFGYQKGKSGWETTAKNHATKDWLNKENIIFLWLGRVSKTGRVLSENERLEMFAENRRFSAKMGGLVSPWNFVARIFFSWNQSAPDMFFWNHPYTP